MHGLHGAAERATTLDAVSDLDALLAEVRAGSALRHSSVHGEQHWRAVAQAGLVLCRELPRADAEVVFLFALLHDARRENENVDPLHGPRAAALANELAQTGAVALSAPRLALLEEACTLHDTGAVSANATVGACFDADRLNLWRVGWTPDPALLSTEPARRRPLLEEAVCFHFLRLDWESLAVDYGSLVAAPRRTSGRWGASTS
jgi:uncharacterized protein